MLPHWYRRHDVPSASPDYTKLKTAALALAQASPQELRNVIEAYSGAYCKLGADDAPKASGMFLLLRVLFVVPTRVKYGAWFGNWPRFRGAVRDGGYTDLSWPVHIDPETHVLHVEPFPPPTPECCFYHALAEYDYFAAYFPRRSAAEIAALEVK
jgi:hypothetical protein